MIRTDSRLVNSGDTFIAIKNVNTDGHDFISSAIEKGATKIICEHGSYPVETIVVEDTRKYLENYLYENVYPKIKDMKLIGVTGTNGKTTICYLVFQMLKSLGVNAAYIGTIGFYYQDKKRELNNTTPDVDIMYQMLEEAHDAGCEVVVMEVSSHALDQNRIHGLSYDEVAFTNLTQDHLDYHKTIENYAKAKEILFTKTRGSKVAIINQDDPYYKRFVKDENKNILISKEKGDVTIKDMTLSHLGTDFSFEYENKIYKKNILMVGRYNVYNYLTSLFLVKELGYEIEDILKIEVKAPTGRMELIPYKTNSVFVDYAHTPDAVLNVLKASLEYKKGKVYTLVGCGGDRDKTKRPIMGHIAEEYSDYVIYTSDNPRTEDAKQIIEDILTGVKKDNHEVVIDRKEAILKGMSYLKENDIFMILGKGHEDYQIIGREKHHFSDQEIVLDYINER